MSRSLRLVSRVLRAPLAMVQRRLRWGPLLFLACFSAAVQAGNQREEPLIDSVRTALSAAVHQSGPPVLVHADVKAANAFGQWLTLNETRLEKQLQRRRSSSAAVNVANVAIAAAPNSPNAAPDLLAHELASPHLRREFLQTVWYESQRAGLEPSLVLGLIQVESGFRKFAISSAGARGFMQVMPFWTRVLAEGDASVLFQAQTNLRFGCVILRHYLNVESGDLFLALGRYNGSRGQAPYPNAVLAAQKGWQ